MEIRRKKIMNIDLRLGDCLEVLKTIPDNSVDSVVTDPPYHLTSTKGDKKGFMGKDWDGGDIAFRTDVWSECLRVLKPGGHLLSFSHSRTYHRMAVAIEDAGFEIRDSIMWIYGSGFPKSHNIGKAIDKVQGNEREVLGTSKGKGYSSIQEKNLEHGNRPYIDGLPYEKADRTLTKGNSDYEGWGTALKPAHEPICMARKPLSEKSIAENVLKWGTGGINIDGCRIAANWEDERPPSWFNSGKSQSGEPTYGGNLKTLTTSTVGERLNDGGRFPANIILDEEAGKLLDEQSGISKSTGAVRKKNTDTNPTSIDFNHKEGELSNPYAGQVGGASRFFYCPKTSKKERNAGLDELPDRDRPGQTDKGLYSSSPYCIDCGKTINGTNDHTNCKEGLEYKQSTTTTKNNHPTVKPIKLMEYLIKLVTPKGGVVLDCFMGSGSTGVAAVVNGFKFIGIEREQEYMDIAKQRITKPQQMKDYESYK